MRLRSFASIAPVVLLASASAFAAHPPVHRGPTPPHPTHPHVASSKPAGMESGRATQIQTALIKAGYLTGEPTGTWDAPSQAAMEKLQSDNGWQTRLVPDSRAIIKLGLGPQAPATAASAEPADASAEPNAPANAPSR